MNASESLQFDIRAANARLDRLLAAELGISRGEAVRLLDRGQVRVAGRRVSRSDKGLRPAPGERVAVEAFVREAEQRPAPNPDLELEELATGPGWLIVRKPAGTPVHPLGPGERDTLLNAVIARHPEIEGVGEGGLRCGLVHRLDVETSGAVAFALDEARYERLRGAFRGHAMRKVYLAIVAGRVAEAGQKRMHLVIARHSPAKVRVVEPGEVERTPQTRLCDLAWRCLERFTKASLVEIELGTGFLHQIRVMFAALGHPLLGDPLYAGEGSSAALAAPRPMLHAAALEFEEIRGRCDPPADFQQVLARLRSGSG
ncbi:MAG: RluA family pseudouridine synthase [Phycisphaeraceae bacterium]